MADPIDFRGPAERERWLTVYDHRLEKGDPPGIAEEFANEDMAVRRRVWPMAVGEPPSYADLVGFAIKAGNDLLALQRRFSRDPEATAATPAYIELAAFIERLESLDTGRKPG